MKKSDLPVSPFQAKDHAKDGKWPFSAILVTLFALLFTSTAATASAKARVESIDSSDVRYQVENGVATIFGTADDMIQKLLIERIVLGFSDVEEVRNELELIEPESEIDNNIGATAGN